MCRVMTVPEDHNLNSANSLLDIDNLNIDITQAEDSHRVVASQLQVIATMIDANYGSRFFEEGRNSLQHDHNDNENHGQDMHCRTSGLAILTLVVVVSMSITFICWR